MAGSFHSAGTISTDRKLTVWQKCVWLVPLSCMYCSTQIIWKQLCTSHAEHHLPSTGAHAHYSTLLTGFLNPRKEPKKVRGRETPNQRQRRASKVVKGMAPEDPTPQSMRFRTKNTTNTTPGTKNDVINTLLFQRTPPITGGRGENCTHTGISSCRANSTHPETAPGVHVL